MRRCRAGRRKDKAAEGAKGSMTLRVGRGFRIWRN